MDRLDIERIGGFAGFGAADAHLESTGSVEMSSLSTQDQQRVHGLFQAPAPAPAPAPDAFRYRITRHSSRGSMTVEVCEDQVPHAVRAAVKDRLV